MKNNMFLVDQEKVYGYIRNNQDQIDYSYADAVCRQTFTFCQPWDMEKCLEPVHFEKEIDWCHLHNHDREWMWMLNRHRYWIPVIHAYVATGNDRYLNAVLGQWEHWLDTQKDPEGRHLTTWRTIDAGIRLRNWVKLLEYLTEPDLLPPELLDKITDSVRTHIVYIFSRYRRECSLTNWRVLEFTGVFLASVCFSQLPEAERWREESLAILGQCIRLQVTGDGFHWEQSYMYHAEMLLCMSEVILIGERNQVSIPRFMIEITQKMADAMIHMITPGGLQLCHGDSDVEPLGELLAGLAYQFRSETYGYFADKEPTVSLAGDYGSPLLDAWDSIGARAPEQTDYAHEDVGNYFVRTGWRADDSYLFFKNGFLGSGHGHCDLLHFEVISRGVPILVDSGRFTYREDSPDRQRFKAGSAHNTILVDGEEFTVQNGSWDNTKVATAIKRPCVLNRDIAYLQGAHMGYFEKGVFLNRKLIYIKPDIWIVVDECFSGQIHQYRQQFHFAGKGSQVEDHQVVYHAGGHIVRMIVPGDGIIEKNTAVLSPGYNQSYESDVVTVEASGRGTTVLAAVILAEDRKNTYKVEEITVRDMSGAAVSRDYASAWSIQKGDESWLVFTNHKEEDTGRAIYLLEGIPVYGRTGVICQRNGDNRNVVLEY